MFFFLVNKIIKTLTEKAHKTNNIKHLLNLLLSASEKSQPKVNILTVSHTLFLQVCLFFINLLILINYY